jgi:hypothetical protein
MKYKFLELKKYLGRGINLGFLKKIKLYSKRTILLFCSIALLLLFLLVFLFYALVRSEAQYLDLGGKVNELTLVQRAILASDFIKESYLKTPAQRKFEQEQALRNEEIRQELPMNQKTRVAFFLKGSHRVEVTTPRGWRQYVVTNEDADNQVTFSYATSSDVAPLFSLKLHNELASNSLPKGENVVKNQLGQIITIMLFDTRPRSPEMTRVTSEIAEVVESAEVFKNQ